MINKECFTTEWIEDKSKELNYPDKNIIEKVIHAFSLLDMLADSGCPFHFKGGSILLSQFREDILYQYQSTICVSDLLATTSDYYLL